MVVKQPGYKSVDADLYLNDSLDNVIFGIPFPSHVHGEKTLYIILNFNYYFVLF